MLMDKILDWLAVILPFAGSIYLALKPPKRWQWGLVAFGLAVSILIFIQQDRSRKNHESELLTTTTRLEQTSEHLGKLSSLLDQYMATSNPDEEAKRLGAAVKQALEQAQRAARTPNAPTIVHVTVQ